MVIEDDRVFSWLKWFHQFAPHWNTLWLIFCSIFSKHIANEEENCGWVVKSAPSKLNFSHLQMPPMAAHDLQLCAISTDVRDKKENYTKFFQNNASFFNAFEYRSVLFCTLSELNNYFCRCRFVGLCFYHIAKKN